MESIIYYQLLEYLEEYQLINDRQHNFQSGPSADNLLTLMTHHWTEQRTHSRLHRNIRAIFPRGKPVTIDGAQEVSYNRWPCSPAPLPPPTSSIFRRLRGMSFACLYDTSTSTCSQFDTPHPLLPDILKVTPRNSLNTDSDTSVSSEIVTTGPSTAKPPARKRGRVELMDSHLASSIDPAKLSDRKAAIVITSTLKSAGSDPMEFTVNRPSVRRERQKHRKEIAESLKRQGIEQLLSVPKLDRGTGEPCASAVHGTILEWGLSDKVKCMCFDTTAVNSGLRNGACILLEQKMEKDMLWLACRHHILEIVLEAVVSTTLSSSSGPDILIFKRFKNYWSKIDQTGYKTVTSDPHSLKLV
ncbi:hypothetical protein EVAR_18667_1 [Eumeta japonica]|uniref:Uncharacterized protein n=1 Tax=Eumeta variegata TaxID=151549 RepID=A0A4C1U838_EUMVA|nr:hypothetical protein EVAR_18667_1 [Eumeta japonica]